MNNCKNCKERQIGCHSTCERYKEFCEKNDKLKDMIRKGKEQDSIPERKRKTQY